MRKKIGIKDMFCFEHLVEKMVPLTEVGKTGGSTGFGSGRVIRSSLTALLSMTFLPDLHVEMSGLDTVG